MELHEYIATKLGITDEKQKDCISAIVANTVVLNEYRTGHLTEQKLDMLVKIIGAFLDEMLQVMNNPDRYRLKMQELEKNFKSFQ